MLILHNIQHTHILLLKVEIINVLNISVFKRKLFPELSTMLHVNLKVLWKHAISMSTDQTPGADDYYKT